MSPHPEHASHRATETRVEAGGLSRVRRDPRYAIRQAVDARTDGRLRLWPATLYGSIGEVEDAGLIEEWTPGDATDALPRRFDKLTRLGVRVLVAETERLEALVRLARASIGRRRLT